MLLGVMAVAVESLVAADDGGGAGVEVVYCVGVGGGPITRSSLIRASLCLSTSPVLTRCQRPLSSPPGHSLLGCQSL